MKRAVITGGASPEGIGWATALAFANDGYEVIVTGISQEEVQRAPSHISIRAVVLNVREDSAVDELFAGFDALDVLVNCAGTANPNTEFTPSGFATTLDVNLTGTMRCCIAAKPLLTHSHGAIVNV